MKQYNFGKNYVYLLIAAPGFMAYATCTNLQRYLKEAAFIESASFQAAFGSMFLFTLLFKIGHNVFLARISPFNRMIVGYLFLVGTQVIQIAAQLIPFNSDHNNVWIAYVTYVCGGIGMGCYDPNMLSVSSEISDGARYYAVLGIVVGVNIVSIGSFFVFGVLEGLMTESSIAILLFSATLACCIAAIITSLYLIPRQVGEEGDIVMSLTYMMNSLRNCKEWLFPLFPGMIALMCNIFAVQEFVPGITLYSLKNNVSVRLLGTHIATEYFRCLYSFVAFVSNLSSRMIFERTKLIFPPLFLYFDLLGALLIISGIPEIMLLGVFSLEMASGGCFIQVTKSVRLLTDGTEWNLFAYSFLLFIGDLGSLAAGESQQSLVYAICVEMRAKMSFWDICPYY